MKGCLSVVKRFESGKIVVRCNTCMTYNALTDDEYQEYLSDKSDNCKECSRAMRAKHRVGMHQPYGMLRTVARVVDRSGNVGFVCKCDCGNYIVRRDSVVYCGYSKSCGCKNGNFYNFEWKGDENYTITEEDIKAIDKLVCMLGSDLKVDSKVCVTSATDSTDNTNAVTLESLRERFMSPTVEVSEDSAEDVASADESTNSVEMGDEGLPWDKPAEGIEEETLSEEVVSSVEMQQSVEELKEDTAELEEIEEGHNNNLLIENALRESLVLLDPSKDLKGESITYFNLKLDLNLDFVFKIISPLMESRGFHQMTGQDKDVSSLVEFLGNLTKDYIDDIVECLYDESCIVLVRKEEGKVVAIMVLGKEEISLYTWVCGDFIATAIVGVLGGLYVHSC